MIHQTTFRTATVLALALIVLGTARGQDAKDSEDEVRALLDAGLRAYEEAELLRADAKEESRKKAVEKYTEAYQNFEKAFGKIGESSYKEEYAGLLRAFMLRSGEGLVAQMMNAPDEQLRNSALRLHKLAGALGVNVIKDEATIKEYIELLKSDRYQEHSKATGMLKHSVPYSFKFLLPYLSEESHDMPKARVMMLLELMGRDAVPALIAGLKSKKPLMQENCAALLGRIRDERAIPYLKKLYEDPNNPPTLKAEVNEALQKITGKEVARLKSAKDEFLQLAEKYYYGVPSVLIKFYPDYFVFDWDAEKDELKERQVYGFLYEEEMAEEACYEALRLDANYETVWPVLCCTYYSSFVDLEKMIEVSEGQPEFIPSEYVAKLKEKMNEVRKAIVHAQMTGRKHLYSSLIRAANDGKAEIAVACLKAIETMGTPEELPPREVPIGAVADGRANFGYPLVMAIDNLDSKLIRYAAARTMIRLNPQEERLGMELAIPNLVLALGETSIKTALIIHDMRDKDDRAFVQSLLRILGKYNIHSRVATSGSEGLDMSRRFPGQDVIFIQSKIHNQVWYRETILKESIIESVLDTLKKDNRTKNTPVILLCEDRKDEEVQKTIFQDTTKVAKFFVKPPHGQLPIQEPLLKSITDEAISDGPARGDATERANRVAEAAADALSLIDPKNTLFPYRDAIDPLIKALGPDPRRADPIRILCIRALGRYADRKPIDILAMILANKDGTNDKPVRIEAAKAISQILRDLNIPPSADVFQVFKDAVVEPDYDLSLAVSEAVGNAKLTNQQRLEMEVHVREARLKAAAEQQP